VTIRWSSWQSLGMAKRSNFDGRGLNSVVLGGGMIERPADLPPAQALHLTQISPLPFGLHGYGLAPAQRLPAGAPGRQPNEDERRWLVYRVDDQGADCITPKRHGRDYGESLSSAAARIQQELQLTLPKMGRSK
jgi:hypothetical protein